MNTANLEPRGGSTSGEQLTIVGSRLQALIFAVGAGAVGIGLWDRFGVLTLLAVVPLFIAASLTLHRRVELHPDRAIVRHQLRPTRTVPRSEIRASTGHRYLRLDSSEATIRIEVPVEIRPEVREWAERT
jgi:hypothetical protein